MVEFYFKRGVNKCNASAYEDKKTHWWVYFEGNNKLYECYKALVGIRVVCNLISQKLLLIVKTGEDESAFSILF